MVQEGGEKMKILELSKRKSKNGRRKFKAVLHEIFPDSCIDEVNEVGTQYNINGITWIREYCEKAMESIKDMSIRAEFLDEAKTELNGHGDTGFATIDNEGTLLPTFANAENIGHFTDAYIDTIKGDDGEDHVVMIGEGYLDEMCYKSFVDKLEEDMENNNAPFGSIEIFRTDSNEEIVYKYGYKAEGRIPMEFIYSGFALLGVPPADHQSKIVELNKNLNEEDVSTMNETEIKAIVEQVVNDMSQHTVEINNCKAECEAKIAEANAATEAAIAEKNEIEASSQQIQAALDQLRAEYAELNKKYDALWDEQKQLEKALGEAKAKERIAELSNALSEFSDDEKSYAQAEIDAFEKEPTTSEINSVVAKIYEGIGKKAKEDAEKAAVVAEQNSAKNTEVEDIFGEVTTTITVEDTSIF